jgi:hypothetical protein
MMSSKSSSLLMINSFSRPLRLPASFLRDT